MPTENHRHSADAGSPNPRGAAPGEPREQPALSPRRTSRRGLMRGAAAAAAAAPLAGLAGHATDSQPAAAQPDNQIAVAEPGATAFEFIGRLDQEGAEFRAYGYVTFVRGLPDALLFTDPANRSEATARLTFTASATMTGRTILGNIFVVDAAGELQVHVQASPAGNFERPASFAGPSPVAVIGMRIQNILNVQAPDQGIATGETDSTQQSATPFTLAGMPYTFGRTGLRSRISFTGQGTRTDANLPRSFILLAGNAVVAG
jgi:hypothetical protein